MSLFIAKGERFYEYDYFSVTIFLGKNLNFLVTAFLVTVTYSFLVMEPIVFICFLVFKHQLTSIGKYFNTLYADQVY